MSLARAHGAACQVAVVVVLALQYSSIATAHNDRSRYGGAIEASCA